MSVLLECENYKLLDHRDYTLKLYNNVTTCEDERTLSFALAANLFSITRSNQQISRKRFHHSKEKTEETLTVRKTYEKFIEHVNEEVKTTVRKYCTFDTEAVRSLSTQLFESTEFDHAHINGGNNSDKPLKCKVKGEYFLIPQNSRFFCGCVKEQCLKLNDEKFDIIIADPPWWNKYIRRLKNANEKMSYNMMYNEDIASITIKNLLSSNCLIAVWCTNSPSNVAAVKNMIFPNWGVEYLTTWYWLKVTVDLIPLCEFGDEFKKQPYERLILGKVGDVELPKEQLIISVPSALHSHKPPLLEILQPYLAADNPKTLELFARYLLPNTTSLGYEPLKWQHISLYERVS